MSDDAQRSAVEVVLVGVHGHGRHHLRGVLALAAEDPGVRLAAVCDPRPPQDDQLADLDGVPVHPDLASVPDAGGVPRVTIVCTPIHTHVDLALKALAQGSHVLLEKPTTPSLAEFDRLVAGAAAHPDLAVQVGFQSLGCAAVAAVRRQVADGAVGEVLGIGAAGAWQRDTAYFTRSAWSGKRVLNGIDVVDGVLTNPFAHAVATALALDGSTRRGQVAQVELELFRANDIESDDTSALRLRTARGTTVTVAVTLAAAEHRSPHITVHGSEGSLAYFYKTGEVRLRTAAGEQVTEHPTTGLLADLVRRARDPEHRVLVPPEETGAFMEVLEQVRLAPAPRPIPPDFVEPVDSGGVPRLVLGGVDALVERSARELALFSELDAPWAARTEAR